MTQTELFRNIWNTADFSEQIELTEKYLSIYPDIDSLVGQEMWENSLLHLACYVDNIQLVTYLLDKNANVNVTSKGRNPLHAALNNDNKHQNQLQIVQLLTEHGVNIRQRTEEGYKPSCFLLALQCCNINIVNYLDNKYPESCSATHEFIEQGLHFASSNQLDHNVLTYCLQLNQEVNKIDENGETPILRTFGEKNKTQQLIQLGAAINFQDNFGTTVMHISIGSEIETAINCAKELDTTNTEFLLANGADKTLTNKNGYTPLDIATKGYGGKFLTDTYSRLFEEY